MKMFKNQAILILTIFLFSCQDELNLNDENNSETQITSEKKIENGRFVFSNKESLEATIQGFQNDFDSNVEKEFEKLYNKGYRSHSPIINPKNESLIVKLSEEIKQKRLTKNEQSTNIDEENYILDPLLAAVVNENDEIVINDTLYKFTREKGLFFTHIKDSTYLFDYFNKEKSKNDIQKTTSCQMKTLYGGVTRIDDRISRYIRPVDQYCFSSVDRIISIPPSAPQTSEEEKLQLIIDNLTECDGNANGNWVQNLFGTSKVCRNYFSSGRRIKTEFWDQGFGFYKSVGILTKTQTKNFGIWWASDADEIHLGINKIFLKYEYNIPDISSISHPDLFNRTYKAPIYMHQGKFKARQILGMTFVDVQINTTKNDLPFFNFGHEEILNIYIPKLFNSQEYNINLTTQDITSQSNIKALYKMGIDFLKNEINDTRKEFVVSYQNSDEEIEVIYFPGRYKKTNTNEIKKRFYKDTSFLLGGIWGESNGWSFSIKPADEFFRDYTHYEIDFYGMARRGSEWKGNRMIR